MNIFWSEVLMYAFKIFSGLLGNLTPSIKSELNDLMTGLYLKALKTPNVFDDFFVGMLLDILAIPRPPPE